MTGHGRFLIAVVALGAALVALGLAGCGSDGGGGGADTTASATDTAGGTDATTDGPDTATADTVCVPNCTNRQCGVDPVCGQPCGPGCDHGFSCTVEARCVCAPACGDQQCGTDPVCGQSCGECGFGTECDADSLCTPVDNLSCPGYFVCAGQCAGDADCATACLESTEDSVQELAGRVRTCFDESCGECTDIDCLQTCGSEHCGADYLSCFSGDQICYQVYACVNACVGAHDWGTPGYAACRLDCLALGDLEAQENYLALEDCIDGYCDRSDLTFTQFIECEQSRRHRECRNQSAKCPEL